MSAEPKATGRPSEYAIDAQCPACQTKSEMAVTQSGRPPRPGTISICMRCGEVSMYDHRDGRLQLRDLQAAEWDFIANDRNLRAKVEHAQYLARAARRKAILRN